MIRVMDLDSDGLISLDELEHYMKDIQEYIQASKDDSVDCTKVILCLVEGLSFRPFSGNAIT